MSRFCLLLLPGLACFLSAPVATAQFGTQAEGNGPRLDKEQVVYYQVGIVVEAEGGPCADILGTTPVPIEWPEQQVRVLKEDFSPFVGNVSYRMLGGTVKQMVVQIPQLPAGEEARAVVTFEITRRSLLPPDSTTELSAPARKELPKDVRTFLGTSPYIESGNAKIKKLAKEITDGKDAAWEKVEAIYDWVRDNVEYKEGPIKGALAALADKSGDCEELTSLFVALCRASGIPARVVWVPQHCYPEFYLQDAEGNGFWFPCQAAGTRDFGGIPELRPIWQKGDNFKTPEEPRQRKRYVAEFLTGSPVPGGGSPKVKFVREACERPQE